MLVDKNVDMALYFGAPEGGLGSMDSVLGLFRRGYGLQPSRRYLRRFNRAAGFGDLGWGIPNPIKAVSNVAKGAAKAASTVGKGAARAATTVAKAPVTVVKSLPSVGSTVLKASTAVAKTPFKAATALTKAGADVVKFGAKSVADIAKAAGSATGTIAMAPTRAALEFGKGAVGGTLRTVGGAFSSGGGGGGGAAVSPETRDAAIEVAQSTGLSPSPAPSYGTTAASGYAPGAFDTSQSALTADGQGQTGGESEKPGMSLAMKLGIGAGAAILLYLGYRSFRSRRGGGRPKS